MNILLVEPDVALAKIYCQALEQAGYTVQVARTAQGAVHAADTGHPDLVILELQLVSHSGIEFLYEFRSYSEWQRVPVLILSQVPRGEFAFGAKSLSAELGIVDYLYKPQTSLQTLLKAVQKVASQQLKIT